MAMNAVMSSSAAVDLALLGLVVERARTAQELVELIKMVGDDHFTPTAQFIEGRMEHLIQSDHLSAQHDRLSVTPSGRAHLRRLLRLDIDPRAPALRGFCTTLKLCLLDLVSLACRREVAAGLVAAGRRRAEQLEAAQGSGCPMIERCLALERQRAVDDLRWMQELVAAEGVGEAIT